jgi:U3 small nucleolar RNA-associated protein 25
MASEFILRYIFAWCLVFASSSYLQQSILLSPFKMPETRALFNNTFKNAAGKVRIEKVWPAIQVPESIDQVGAFFIDLGVAYSNKHFAYFTTQVIPVALALMSLTLHYVSCYQGCSNLQYRARTRWSSYLPHSISSACTTTSGSSPPLVLLYSLSEFCLEANIRGRPLTTYRYSTNQDISRARQAFFSGKKAFLLISEHFHFYCRYVAQHLWNWILDRIDICRYKIRGIRNLIFYGTPEHPQFFSEFLSFPLLDDEVEASDVASRVIYSKYDKFRLERIVGMKGAKSLLEGCS